MFVHYVNGLDYIGETKRPFSTGTKVTVPEIQNNVLKWYYDENRIFPI